MSYPGLNKRINYLINNQTSLNPTKLNLSNPSNNNPPISNNYKINTTNSNKPTITFRTNLSVLSTNQPMSRI